MCVQAEGAWQTVSSSLRTDMGLILRAMRCYEYTLRRTISFVVVAGGIQRGHGRHLTFTRSTSEHLQIRLRPSRGRRHTPRRGCPPRPHNTIADPTRDPTHRPRHRRRAALQHGHKVPVRCLERTLPRNLDVQLLQSLHARPQRRDEIVSLRVVKVSLPRSTLLNLIKSILLDFPEPET